jgi:hypothetical protein
MDKFEGVNTLNAAGDVVDLVHCEIGLEGEHERRVQSEEGFHRDGL